MRRAVAILMIVIAMRGCATLKPHAQFQQWPATQPARKVNAGVQAPVGGLVSAALSANREVGSSTAGTGSTAYTFVNSALPIVAFGLGTGAVLILWQREKGAHRLTRRSRFKI